MNRIEISVATKTWHMIDTKRQHSRLHLGTFPPRRFQDDMLPLLFPVAVAPSAARQPPHVVLSVIDASPNAVHHKQSSRWHFLNPCTPVPAPQDLGWHNLGWRNAEARPPALNALRAEVVSLDRMYSYR